MRCASPDMDGTDGTTLPPFPQLNCICDLYFSMRTEMNTRPSSILGMFSCNFRVKAIHFIPKCAKYLSGDAGATKALLNTNGIARSYEDNWSRPHANGIARCDVSLCVRNLYSIVSLASLWDKEEKQKSEQQSPSVFFEFWLPLFHVSSCSIIVIVKKTGVWSSIL